MKNKILLIAFFAVFAFSGILKAQTSPAPLTTDVNVYPWTKSELLEPSVLAADIAANKNDLPLIFNIGVVDDIKGAINIGAANKEENIAKLTAAVANYPKNKVIVVYCGCCPFAKCPNARPAFSTLKKLGFTNVKMLDLPINLRTNWTTKGYPMAKG